MVPEKYLIDIFGDGEPGVGSIFVEKSRQDRTDDIKLAKFLKRKFGGSYVVLSDITPHGVKAPDLLLGGRAIFENKNVTSLTSLDSQIRRALSQLDRDNLRRLKFDLGSKKLRHVVVVRICGDLKMPYAEIVPIIEHRIDRYSKTAVPHVDYVLIRRGGKIKYLWKYKKAP